MNTIPSKWRFSNVHDHLSKILWGNFLWSQRFLITLGLFHVYNSTILDYAQPINSLDFIKTCRLLNNQILLLDGGDHMEWDGWTPYNLKAKWVNKIHPFMWLADI